MLATQERAALPPMALSLERGHTGLCLLEVRHNSVVTNGGGVRERRAALIVWRNNGCTCGNQLRHGGVVAVLRRQICAVGNRSVSWRTGRNQRR